MRKLYIIALGLGMAAAASAQTITFSAGGEELTPGSEITFNDMVITNDYGDDGFDYKFEPHLYFTGSAAGQIDATVKCLTGQSVQFCLGGECVSAAEINKTDISIPANTPQDTQFEWMGNTWSKDEQVPQDVKVTIAINYSGKPETKVELTYIFNSTAGGTVSINKDSDKIYVADGLIRYTSSDCNVLNIFTLGGESVMKKEVNGTGAIDCTGLNKGVYIYTLGSNSGKIIL